MIKYMVLSSYWQTPGISRQYNYHYAMDKSIKDSDNSEKGDILVRTLCNTYNKYINYIIT